MKQNLPANQSTMIIAGSTCLVVLIIIIISAIVFFKLRTETNNYIQITPTVINQDGQ